jgi:DNA invertase Pin-like site-specific DNA recombinase
MTGTNLKAKAEALTEIRRLGYARVSTYGQTLDAQLEQLWADGCVEIYYEKVSGARTDRPELLKLLRALTPGDVVIVTRIDRLARSIFDLFAILKQIMDAGGQFQSLAEPWADTASSTGRLTIAVLGRLIAVERELIRTRMTDGRSRAKARGQRLGHPPKLTDAQREEARLRRAEGATLKELAQTYDVGLTTIFRISKIEQPMRESSKDYSHSLPRQPKHDGVTVRLDRSNLRTAAEPLSRDVRSSSLAAANSAGPETGSLT